MTFKTLRKIFDGLKTFSKVLRKFRKLAYR